MVDRESYLLELVRYVALNPVGAGMVEDLRGWRWSSYRPTSGMNEARSDRARRDKDIARAVRYGYTLKDIAGYLGVHYATVTEP